MGFARGTDQREKRSVRGFEDSSEICFRSSVMIVSWKWGPANGRIDLGLRVISLGQPRLERKEIDGIGVWWEKYLCATSYVHIQLKYLNWNHCFDLSIFRSVGGTGGLKNTFEKLPSPYLLTIPGSSFSRCCCWNWIYTPSPQIHVTRFHSLHKCLS